MTGDGDVPGLAGTAAWAQRLNAAGRIAWARNWSPGEGFRLDPEGLLGEAEGAGFQATVIGRGLLTRQA